MQHFELHLPKTSPLVFSHVKIKQHFKRQNSHISQLIEYLNNNLIAGLKEHVECE